MHKGITYESLISIPNFLNLNFIVKKLFYFYQKFNYNYMYRK